MGCAGRKDRLASFWSNLPTRKPRETLPRRPHFVRFTRAKSQEPKKNPFRKEDKPARVLFLNFLVLGTCLILGFLDLGSSEFSAIAREVREMTLFHVGLTLRRSPGNAMSEPIGIKSRKKRSSQSINGERKTENTERRESGRGVSVLYFSFSVLR